MIERHTLALISIIGSSLDMLGALYLAYDLLGGEHGPLRTLTRGVTYGVLFGTGYGLALGPIFGLASGLAHGVTLAWEFSRASRRGPKPGFWYDTAMSAIRGFGFAVGAAYTFSVPFGITFGLLSTAGQAVAYRFGMRPTAEYKPATRPRMTRLQLIGAVFRTVGYAFTGYFSSLVAGQSEHAIAVGLKVGLVIGVVTAIFGSCTPFIEWFADHVPAKRMGVFGVALILIGFTLQSVQYWVALLDINVLPK
jgi:hypothetical protein